MNMEIFEKLFKNENKGKQKNNVEEVKEETKESEKVEELDEDLEQLIKTTGKTFRDFRDQAKLTLLQVYEQTGISTGVISSWETGKRIPKTEYIVKLCKAVNLPLELIFSQQVLPERPQLKAYPSSLLKKDPVAVQYRETKLNKEARLIRQANNDLRPEEFFKKYYQVMPLKAFVEFYNVYYPRGFIDMQQARIRGYELKLHSKRDVILVKEDNKGNKIAYKKLKKTTRKDILLKGVNYIDVSLGDVYMEEAALNWLESYGYLPNNMQLVHLDGNTENNDINNLDCLTRNEYKEYMKLREEYVADGDANGAKRVLAEMRFKNKLTMKE